MRGQGGGKHAGPGEQRARNYKWNVDVKTYRFGRPGSLASPLCLDSCSEPPARLVSKNLEDFRGTQDSIGRAKNLGHALRGHLGEVGNMMSSELSPGMR